MHCRAHASKLHGICFAARIQPEQPPLHPLSYFSELTATSQISDLLLLSPLLASCARVTSACKSRVTAVPLQSSLALNSREQQVERLSHPYAQGLSLEWTLLSK